jgi:hypothetical protein
MVSTAPAAAAEFNPYGNRNTTALLNAINSLAPNSGSDWQNHL